MADPDVGLPAIGDAGLPAECDLVDGDGFADIYDRFAARLYRYAYQRVGPDAAEDVVADTFLAAFAQRRSYDPERAGLRPWLFGILTRKLARHHRTENTRLRAMARAGAELPESAADDGVAARVSAVVHRRPLADAVARLSPGDRDVLLLTAWGDLTYDEVASALAIPIGTVRSRLNRARRKVREALGGVDPTTEAGE